MSRAGLVDLKAVKDALKVGKISKYVVDFPTVDALKTKNIIVIPHLERLPKKPKTIAHPWRRLKSKIISKTAILKTALIFPKYKRSEPANIAAVFSIKPIRAILRRTLKSISASKGMPAIWPIPLKRLWLHDNRFR